MRNIKPLKIVDAKGTWLEIGRQYGEDCSEDIKKNIDVYIKAMGSVTKADKKAILAMSQKFVKPVKEYAPECIDETKGIAEGAKVSFEEVFFLTASCELECYYSLLAGGCTSFACTGEATKNGETIVGQNLDWHVAGGMVDCSPVQELDRSAGACSIADQVVIHRVADSQPRIVGHHPLNGGESV